MYVWSDWPTFVSFQSFLLSRVDFKRSYQQERSLPLVFIPEIIVHHKQWVWPATEKPHCFALWNTFKCSTRSFVVSRIMIEFEAYSTPVRLITSIAFVIIKPDTKHFDKVKFQMMVLPYSWFVTASGVMLVSLLILLILSYLLRKRMHTTWVYDLLVK